MTPHPDVARAELRERIAKVWHEAYFAHPWENEDIMGRKCALQAADALLAFVQQREGAPHKCPVCEGQGTMNKPPWIPGDQREWSASGTNAHPCRVCSGAGIVWATHPDRSA